jgi:glycosyltransferase involved in cell wall biosynthesis
MKVLLSAYACEPGKGSEPGVGWNWVRQIARFHEVWAITRVSNRQAIETALAEEPLPNVHWVYFDLPHWARFWKRGPRRVHAYYYLWQLGAYFVARKLHRQIGFNLGHHLTFVNYWMPSFLASLPVPFVWGPVGGGESAPRSFRSSFSWRGRIYETLRDLARVAAHRDPFLRHAARRAAVALTTTEDTGKRIRALGSQTVLVFSEAGLSIEEIRRLGGLPARLGHPFRLISIGNLLHLKGFELGLRAFARFHIQFPDSEYWLVGDGPERKRLERLAEELGVRGSVTFWGRVPRTEVLKKLAECDVLVHPSLHDSGGWVCLEAMAAGRPVLCLDLGGPGFQVTKETGIKVPPISPAQVIGDLSAAMCQLAGSPAHRARLGEGGRKRVQEFFAWERKAEYLMRIYSRIAQEGGTCENLSAERSSLTRTAGAS